FSRKRISRGRPRRVRRGPTQPGPQRGHLSLKLHNPRLRTLKPNVRLLQPRHQLRSKRRKLLIRRLRDGHRTMIAYHPLKIKSDLPGRPPTPSPTPTREWTPPRAAPGTVRNRLPVPRSRTVEAGRPAPPRNYARRRNDAPSIRVSAAG